MLRSKFRRVSIFFHNCELSQYNLLDTQWKKKSCEMIACPPRHPFLFRFFFFLDHFFRPSTYHHQGLITRTVFFLLCRFIIQILMRCLVPCVWTSSTKLGRHYMISQIFLRASSLNSSLIPIPQIRSMGTQQPCIFTGKYESKKKRKVEWWLVITVFPTI